MLRFLARSACARFLAWAWLVLGSTAAAQDCLPSADFFHESVVSAAVQAQTITVAGGFAYTLRGPSGPGLYTTYVADPENPLYVGSQGIWGTDFVIDGSWGYVTHPYGGMSILSLANPAFPQIVGNLPLPGYTASVAVTGSRVFATGSGGLYEIDATNKSNPMYVGNTPGSANGIRLVGSRAYVCQGGLSILDISTPGAPSLLGFVAIPGAWDLVINGTYAYVVARNAGLKVVDVSNPGAPVVVASVETIGEAFGVALGAAHLYLVDQLGVQIFDVTNPLAPILVATRSTAGVTHDVACAGSYVYVADREGGLLVIEALPADTRVFVSTTRVVGNTYDIEIGGTDAFVAVGGGVRIFDVSNPAAPSVRANIGSSSGEARRVTLVGSRVFVSDGPGGFSIHDVSNPSAPIFEGGLNTSGWTSGIAVQGSLAYVADGSGGLLIYDVSNPAAIGFVGFYPGFARDVVVLGNVAYLVAPDDGVRVLDVSNPATPVLLGTLVASGVPYAIHLDGSHAYVADAQDGLVILDISNPAAPFVVGQASLPDYSLDVTVSGSFAYVAGENSGTHMVDITNPFHPFLVGTLDSPGCRSTAVTVAGSLQYVADQRFGVAIMPALCEPAPTASMEPLAGPVALNPVRPTPTRDVAIVSFALQQRTPVHLDVYDVAGKVVRRLVAGTRSAGPHHVTWDTRDDAGNSVPNGVYLVRLKWEGGQSVSRATIVR